MNKSAQATAPAATREEEIGRLAREERERSGVSPKAGWRQVRLDEVCGISSVLVDPREPQYRGMPHVGGANIESETGRLRDLKTAQEEGLRSGKFVFDSTMVLYSKIRPYLKKVARPEFRGLCSADIYPLTPDRARLEPDYLFYILLSAQFTDFAIAGSARAGMPKVNREHLFGFQVSLPPLPEQRRIVGILDEAFDGIATAKANTEKNLQNADSLFRETFRSITDRFGLGRSRRVTVAELALRQKGSIRTGPFGSQLLHSEFVDHGVAVLGIDNAVTNSFSWAKRRFITPTKFKDLSRYQVHPGDVLITIMGTCGRCAVVPDDIPVAINTKHLCCITLDQEKCLPAFLHAYFLHHPVAHTFLSSRSKGAIMAGLNMDIIKQLPVLLPPIDVQTAIINAIEVVRSDTQRLVSIYQRKLAALDDLKKSLLHQAFSGAL